MSKNRLLTHYSPGLITYDQLGLLFFHPFKSILMHHNNKQRKRLRLAITGPVSAPKLFTALQLAYGLTGAWDRIIVIGNSPKDNLYHHLGSYHVLSVSKGASPQRYADLLNLCSGCNKDAVIFSTFADEWREGVGSSVQTGYHEEALRGHRLLFEMIRHSQVHVIVCIDSKKKLLYQSGERHPKIRIGYAPIQEEGFERHLTSVLALDKKGMAKVEKDTTKVLPAEIVFKPSVQTGALLQDWCYEGCPLISLEMQHRIDRCTNLAQLY
ncbi:MAG: hypothetical protein EOP49_53305, partial [Sphingobacteriales bacterium]